MDFYIEQYRKTSRKNKRRNIRTTRFMHKVNSKAKSIARANVNKNQGIAVSLLHQDVKRLAFLAYHFNNKEAINVINRQIIPHMVRLDLALFEEKELAEITEDFLRILNREASGAICNKNLKELYNIRRAGEIRKEIMSLVPRRPEMEFPESLKMKRHFIIHSGPTNSGKTYNAISRLKECENGVYLGPLRLLALEVYETMMEAGVKCTMITGQECIETPNSTVTASTVEMLDIDMKYDIAVIDETQMVADEDRGHSWTRAILGIRADEIHICMSEVAEKVVIHLIELCGDDYEIRHYERKTELEIEEHSFEFPKDVRGGDAFIVFSKKSVLNIAGQLEKNGIKASVIYGSLPPEIRRRQIKLFNEGKTRVVVSTDAIGMGLNLPVRRIVFLEVEKFDGIQKRHLSTSEVKQIAGRAGRFGKYEIGFVTAMGDKQHGYIKDIYNIKEKEIEKVNLGFPQVLLNMDAPLDIIIKLWHDEKPVDPFIKIKIDVILFLYKEAEKNRTKIADFDDKKILYKMITCPIDVNDKELVNLWKKYCFSYNADIMLSYPSKKTNYQGLLKYESFYKKLDLYYQMSVRMGKIIDVEWLEKEREKTQTKIMNMLSKDKNDYIIRCKYCGTILPVGTKYSICDKCFESFE